MRNRTTREVLEDHLRCRHEQRLEDDLARNYAEDVVMLSAEGVHRGHDGVRALAQVLHRYVPRATFEVHDLFVEGEIGLETWSGDSGDKHAHDGADTFVVRDGLITAQTIHFSVRDDGDGSPSGDDG